MDSDSFYPAIIRAAQVIGLGEVVLKKIQALGIRLNEEEPKPPFPYTANLNKIEWFNKAQNKVKELIVGLSFGNLHFLEMTASGNWGNSLLSVQSTDVEPEGEQASVSLGVVDRISKAVKFRTLLDSEQRSNYIQIHSNTPKNIRMLSGLVQNNGSIIFGTGYTVNHFGVGEYAILLTGEGFPAGYVVAGVDAQNTGRLFSYATINASQFNVTMYNQAAGFTKENIAFSFIMIGSA